MSTIGYENWAVDMADVGAIYPFQGSEGFMVLLCVLFWLGWHVIQFRRESAHLEEAKKVGDADAIAKALDRY